MFQIYDGHHAFYQLDPDSGECGEIPLERAALTATASELLRTLHKPTAASASPVWGGEGMGSHYDPVNSFSDFSGHLYLARADSSHSQPKDTGTSLRSRIPSWTDQRQAKGPALDSLRSKVTAAQLAAIPALPHTAPEKVFVADLHRYGGKSGAQRELHVCAGDLTTLAQRLQDGVHMEDVQIMDIRYQDSKERQRARSQLKWLHDRYPEGLPETAMSDWHGWSTMMQPVSQPLSSWSIVVEWTMWQWSFRAPTRLHWATNWV